MKSTLLVIPHYNDTARLETFLRDLLIILPQHFVILVSDDGSRDIEREKLDRLVKENKSKLSQKDPVLLDPLFTERNTGKGGAVYRGWNHFMDAELVAFADADGAVSAREIVRAESFFRSDACVADALFGSRVKMLGRSIQRSLLRHLTGRVFATIVSEVGRLPSYDTQCGLKLLKNEAYQQILPDLQCLGFAFDVEIALLLVQVGKKVVEFPIDWSDVPGSKVNMLRDSIGMAWEVMEIRRRIELLQSRR